VAPRRKQKSTSDELVPEGLVKAGATIAETSRKLNRDPRLISALQVLREFLPGETASGKLISKEAERQPRAVGRMLEELSSSKPGALGEAGLGALQLWQSISDAQGRGKGKSEVAIAFTDLVDFSDWALKAGDDDAVKLLREVGRAIEPPVKDSGGTVVKRLGDGMMAVFKDPEAAVGAILEGRDRLGRVKAKGYKPKIRAGIHVGKPRKVKGDYFGVDVNIAARVADAAKGGELLLSDQALDAIGEDAVEVRPRERLTAKGVPEDFRVYAVTSAATS
jgi:class 3 adenylate cyclase